MQIHQNEDKFSNPPCKSLMKQRIYQICLRIVGKIQEDQFSSINPEDDLSQLN